MHLDGVSPTSRHIRVNQKQDLIRISSNAHEFHIAYVRLAHTFSTVSRAVHPRSMAHVYGKRELNLKLRY